MKASNLNIYGILDGFMGILYGSLLIVQIYTMWIDI